MASIDAAASAPSRPTSVAPSQAKISSQIDLAISLLLYGWEALSIAVENSMGGPDSADKRDFLAGALSDLFVERPDTDAEDVEEVLLQYMNDEFGDDFGALIQDESNAPLEVAEKIFCIRNECLRGDFEQVQRLWQRYQQKEARNSSTINRFQATDEDDNDDSDDDEDDASDEPVPTLVRAAKAKADPEVDEDGFTKVVGRKR